MHHHPGQFTAWVHESIDSMTKNDEYILRVAADADQIAKEAYLVAHNSSNEAKSATNTACAAYHASRTSYHKSMYASNACTDFREILKSIDNSNGILSATEALKRAKEALDVATSRPTGEFILTQTRPDVKNAYSNPVDILGKYAVYPVRDGSEEIYYVDMQGTARQLVYPNVNAAAIYASNTVSTLANSNDVDGKWASNQIVTFDRKYASIEVANGAFSIAMQTKSALENDYIKKTDVVATSNAAFYASNTAAAAYERSLPILHIKSTTATPTTSNFGKMIEVPNGDIYFVDAQGTSKLIKDTARLDLAVHDAIHASATAKEAKEAVMGVSNAAYWGSNTVATVSNVAYWGSNQIATTSNVAYWGSNTVAAVSNAAYWGSNKAASASNVGYWSSNQLATVSNVAYWGSNVAQWSSNQIATTSNVAYWSSNNVADVVHWNFVRSATSPNTFATATSTTCNVNIGPPTLLLHQLNINAADNGTGSSTMGLWTTDQSFLTIESGVLLNPASITFARGLTFNTGTVQKTSLGTTIEKTKVVHFARDGSVGINTVNPSERLHVVGNTLTEGSILHTGAVLAMQDARRTDNISAADTTACYNIVQSLPLKQFRTSPLVTGSDTALHYGWLAQDVDPLMPDAVIETDAYGLADCHWVKRDHIYACMYGAIQELQKRVADLESIVNGP